MAWTKRYVRADAAGGGDGTTDTNSGANGAWTFAEAIAAGGASAGMKVIVKGAHGAYTRTVTSSDVVTNAGSTTQPIWWAGCNNAEDDLLGDYVTAHPAITYTASGGRFITSAFNILSHLNITCTATAQAVYSAGGDTLAYRCRFENTLANATAVAAQIQAGTGINALVQCLLKATATATRVVSGNAGWVLIGNAIEGGGILVDMTSNAALIAINNVLRAGGSHGINFNLAFTSAVQVLGNTIAGCGGDGIRITSTFTGQRLMAFNHLVSNGGYGINNSSGTTMHFPRLFNGFYNNTSGEENGFGDSPDLLKQTELVSPFVNLAGGDVTLLLNALAIGNGLPGPLENQLYRSFLDIGAIQAQSGLGAIVNIPAIIQRVGVAAY